MPVQKDFSQWLARICSTGTAESGDLHHDKPFKSPPDSARLDLLRNNLLRQAQLRMLLALTCAEIMHAPVISVTADQTIGEAVNLLNSHRIKLLPVVDSLQRLIGVVTRADIEPTRRPLQVVRPRLGQGEAAECERCQLPVANVMATAVVSIDAVTPLAEIISSFTSKGHHHLPVVSEDKVLLGMLTQSDIVALMYRGM
ncbi:CBS domain-containing protein [Caballeronia sp. LjRoot29]